MSVEQASLHTPKSTLFGMVGVALMVATIIVVCFVLPAEFRIDPTGVGRLSGVIRLAGPKQLSASEAASEAAATSSVVSTAGVAARYYDAGYRSDFVDIPLKASGTYAGGDELEYKVRMKAGATLAYSWFAPGVANPEELYFDFHGEAPAKDPGAEGAVVEYRQATGTQSHGTLVAPFDGVFGWYLQNQSEKPAVVHLKISGFYDLVPPGEYGNEMAIEANKAIP
jgi:hypothetical protein